MSESRYDAVADFYETGWIDSYDDPASSALLELLGPVAGRDVLDAACGHGRISRELARRGARVVGVDLSGALLGKAIAAERSHSLGIHYLQADLASWASPGDMKFDAVVCGFGLSDIDDLDPALRALSQAMHPDARFVFSILHPCFPGAGGVSGAWPAAGTYYDERWWVAEGRLSALRRQVGANHRMLSTYLNALRGHGLWLDRIAEPAPPSDWSADRAEATRYPVFFVARCIRR